MNLERSAIFSVIAIVAVAVLLAGVPIVAGHQTLAFSGHGHGGAYGFYGPCIIRHFSYTWCLNRF